MTGGNNHAGSDWPSPLQFDTGWAYEQGNGGNGLGDYLTYGVRTIAAGGACESTTYASGVLVIADGSVLTGGSSTVQALPAAGSASVTYCFAIKLPVDTPNSMQGKNATATWTFTGTSNS